MDQKPIKREESGNNSKTSVFRKRFGRYYNPILSAIDLLLEAGCGDEMAKTCRFRPFRPCCAVEIESPPEMRGVSDSPDFARPLEDFRKYEERSDGRKYYGAAHKYYKWRRRHQNQQTLQLEQFPRKKVRSKTSVIGTQR